MQGGLYELGGASDPSAYGDVVDHIPPQQAPPPPPSTLQHAQLAAERTAAIKEQQHQDASAAAAGAAAAAAPAAHTNTQGAASADRLDGNYLTEIGVYDA